MKPHLAPGICILLAATVAGCAGTALVNPGLEREGASGGLPAGWVFRSPQEAGYRARIDRDDARRGSASVLLESTGGSPGSFGNLMQVVDAIPYRGKRVRYRAAVRAEVAGGSGSAQLWLRVDREGGRTGFFDNMADRPIAEPQWRTYTIVGDVAADAVTLNLGVFLRGEGRVGFDDAALEIVGPAGAGVVPPRPLSGQGLENLLAFTRLLGYVRYFHPTDEAAETDWDALAIAGVELVESARGPVDLAARLRRLFGPVTAGLRVLPDPGRTGGRRARAEDPAAFVAWYHEGVGLDRRSIYSSRRITVDAGDARLGTLLPHPGQPLRMPLGAGVSCILPLVLPAGSSGGADPGSGGLVPETKPAGFTPTGDDRSTRLAAVILAWNTLQHFYPYFDVVGTDWNRSLRVAFVTAAADPDGASFLVTLRRLVADLHDGHGFVAHPGETRTHRAPVLWEWIENRLVVTRTSPGETRLEPGDVVLRVDGIPAGGALETERSLISGATRQWRTFRAARELGRGSPGDSLDLVVRRGAGDAFEITLGCEPPPSGDDRLREDRPEPIQEIRPGIVYVDLERITDEEFQDALPDLARAGGLVFDLRGYPSVSTGVLAHLIAGPVSSPRWLVPVVTRPNRVGMTFRTSGWSVEPEAPRLEARAVFLADGRAVSYAETYLGIVEHHGIAEIVGGATAGTNGNVNTLRLPGGYVVSWTGMKVLKQDGSRHHGVGIHPTVPVSRTIAGVRDGRDEVLERALELLSGAASAAPVTPPRSGWSDRRTR